MHALVPAILVGGGGLDELRPDPEPQPPDAELREAAKSTGGKGLAVIGADAVGEAVLTEQAAEHYLGRLEERALEPFRSLALAIRLVSYRSALSTRTLTRHLR